MSNKKAVSDYYNKMRDKGFKTLSFLVHENDAKAVKAFVDKLKTKRLASMIISPNETIERIERLNFTDEQFQQIHHIENETPKRHLDYLQGIEKYQENKRNYDVARRIKCIDVLHQDGTDLDKAISLCLEMHPV